MHPATPAIVWVPIIAWLLYRAFAYWGLSPWSVGGIGASAILFWTLTEYVLHRFVFHMRAEGSLQQKFQYIMHGNHHDVSDDPTRLVMPPLVSILAASLFYFLFRFLLGEAWSESFFAFFMVGYLAYDYIHFYVHHFTPTTALGRFLKQNHMLHHFASPHARWGVSSPLWDFVFGTLEEKRPVRGA